MRGSSCVRPRLVVGGLVVSSIRHVVVLGATGSIGTSTLDVIARHSDQYRVFALAANESVEKMALLCQQFLPTYAVMGNADAAQALQRALVGLCDVTVLHGEQGLEQVVSHPDVDTVMAAIVGAAGLPSALAAARAGKTILLANKEALVMAGHLFMAAVRESGANLLPIDSEHNAIFQCLPRTNTTAPNKSGVSFLTLTASGGPFRTWSAAQIAAATPEQACAHPNWSMGRKISVDSASLMNKGLELIEACWLFDVAPENVNVVVHPQSIIHSMVQYVDGSVLAQMGNPDMRTPIAYGLAWPSRIDAGVAPLDLVSVSQLSFEAPDESRFPCLRLAREAATAGGTAMAACNAANEIAVEAFLAERISFGDIPRMIESVLENTAVVEPESLAVVEECDMQSRELARRWLADCS